jgi:hypothetical protein
MKQTEIPPRITALPTDDKGRPIPWFVYREPDLPPDFRVMDELKRVKAVTDSLCWVCGQKLGVYKVFVLGPMNGLCRFSAEPPCHYDCAVYSAKACPFLSSPKMHHREGGLEGTISLTGGVRPGRNPGVTLLWVTRDFQRLHDERLGVGFRIGPPLRLEAYAEGRTATKEEVRHSIETDLPLLLAAAKVDGSEVFRNLAQKYKEFTLAISRWL